MQVLVALAGMYVAGCALGVVWPAPLAPSLVAVGAAAALFVACAAIGRKTILAAAVCALVSGWCRAPEPVEGGVEAVGGPPCVRTISGDVARPPVVLRDRAHFEVEAEEMTACATHPEAPVLVPVRASIAVTVLGERAPLLAAGDRVLVRGVLKRAPRYANFGGQALRGRDDERLVIVAESAGSVARVARDRLDVGAALSAIRARISAFWRGNLEPSTEGLARALVIGESGALDPLQRDGFRRTGTAHLVAVSGMHLAILTWLCFGGLRRALLRIEPLARRVEVGRIAAPMTIPVLLAFAVLVGGQPPVARSCVMASSVLMARALVRRAGALGALSLAAAALLAFDPADIADPGFQLSFAAVASFFVGARHRGDDADPAGALQDRPLRLRALEKIAAAVKRLFFGSLAATAATTPIALYHFDQASLVAVPCNMIAIPFTTVLVMPALFLLSALALAAPQIASYGAAPVGLLLEALDTGLAWAGRPGWAAIVAPAPLISLAIVACCAAALVFAALRGPRSGCVLLAALAFAGAAICAVPAPVPRDRLVLDVLDVGQGSAALVTFPDGRRWLVDAGGSAGRPESFGALHLVPALRGLGVRAIDTMVVSHPDPDHALGATAVLRAFPVRRVWAHGRGAATGEDEAADESYLAFLDEAKRAGIAVEAPPAICGGAEIAAVRAELLHPCAGEGGFEPALSANDNSLVIRLVYGDTAILLPGDLSGEGEERLLASGRELESDVLVLGHHGSDSSSAGTFLDAARPSVAVASVGRDNRYGFPREAVIASLRRREVHLLRTDRHGGVRIVSDGARIEVRFAAEGAPR